MICPKYKAATLQRTDAFRETLYKGNKSLLYKVFILTGGVDCDQQECAWWNKKRKCCGMLPFDTRVVK